MICISGMGFLQDATRGMPDWQCRAGAMCGGVAEGVVLVGWFITAFRRVRDEKVLVCGMSAGEQARHPSVDSKHPPFDMREHMLVMNHAD